MVVVGVVGRHAQKRGWTVGLEPARDHQVPKPLAAGAVLVTVLVGARVTVINLEEFQFLGLGEVVGVDAERGVVLVKGAVPGPRGGVVVLRTSVKNPMKAGGQR